MSTTLRQHKAARLAALATLIESGELDLETANKSELARRFGIDRVTLYRDIWHLDAVRELTVKYKNACREQ